MPFFELKHQLAADLAALLNHPGISPESIAQEFGSPPNPALGHVALPCFRLAKLLGKQSHELAKQIASGLTTKHVQASVAGPYANFKWDKSFLFEHVLSEIFRQKDNYGRDNSGKGKRIVMEYCSPNIAKKLAFHHIRSTLIGHTLSNFYEALGYRTERINFVGDWGSQFARLLAAFELWGDKMKLNPGDLATAMNHLSEIYVQFHKDLESHPERIEKANHCLKRMEENDPGTTGLWMEIKAISLKAMDQTLARLGVHFSHVEGESVYVPQIGPYLEEVKQKANAFISEGAWIVEVEGIPTPALIQKKDGTTLYLTRDIGAAIDRYNRFHFDRMCYVVSEQQKLHFRLLFGVLKKMGYAWADQCEHIAFGTVLFGQEKMSTREGRVILLDDILDEAKARALVLCSTKNPDLSDKEKVAEQIGLGAVIFGELSANRQRDIEFNWDAVLSFDGETGPYVQYSLVRCRSLLEKAKDGSGEPAVPAKYELAPEEEQLVVELSKFRNVLHLAIRDHEPYLVTNYLIDVAKTFNRFYYRFPVLQAQDSDQKHARLCLVRATAQVLTNGLTLLGIPCPSEM